ncbi:hypothetical protein RHMOL_Rhmol05G0275900 [Rhododendron molle]|uniref:Uncharacterized protein n=1 Tax=Rhododendron molle TaxID=49168 RepID=A0ACC0NW45_RHOML|nr:hypothetical protein RHMOL_Rhmol05G0275900 [Rhododendron molle]
MAAPIFFCLQFLCFALTIIGTHAQGGTWEVIVQNAGIAAMHAAVTWFNTVVLLDRTDIGASNLSLPIVNGVQQCRHDPNDLALTTDCSAHSALLDLTIQTDTWCSSGQFLPDGTLLQSGGFNDGNTKFRTFTPCKHTSSCDWVDSKHLVVPRALSVLYDYVNNVIINNLPLIGGGPPNYPSSAMLALEGNYSTATIVICGGSQYDAYHGHKVTIPAQGNCGRIVATDPNPAWEMENMPLVRNMGDMVMLPTGEGQRLVKMNIARPVSESNGEYRIVFQAPPSAEVAPPGYYMMFVVNQGVPSVAVWVPVS